jgi:hypothetical protein
MAEMKEISERLKGVMHHPAAVKDVMNSFNFTASLKDKDPETFIAGLF